MIQFYVFHGCKHDQSSSSCATSTENPFQLFVTDLATRTRTCSVQKPSSPTCRTAQICYILQVLRILKLGASFKLQPFFGRPYRNGLCQPPRSPARSKGTFSPNPSARRATSAMQHSKRHCVHEPRHTAARRATQGHRHFVTPIVQTFSQSPSLGHELTAQG